MRCGIHNIFNLSSNAMLRRFHFFRLQSINICVLFFWCSFKFSNKIWFMVSVLIKSNFFRFIYSLHIHDMPGCMHSQYWEFFPRMFFCLNTVQICFLKFYERMLIVQYFIGFDIKQKLFFGFSCSFNKMWKNEIRNSTTKERPTATFYLTSSINFFVSLVELQLLRFEY